MEWDRFSTAGSSLELASVYRALVPEVERLLRSVLRQHGSRKADTNLRPMIAELETLRLGDRGFWSTLRHIVNFMRDLTEHGQDVSEATLRIACETTFGLIPQIASLAPGAV